MKHFLRGKFGVAALAVAALVVCGTMLSTIGTCSVCAADGDVNVVPDPQLQACINETMFGRAADTPISAAEIASMGKSGGLSVGILNASNYPGIKSLEGLQGAGYIHSVTFNQIDLSDLTPLGGMPGLTSINVQNYTTSSGVVDLTPLAGIAGNIAKLTLNVSITGVPTTQIIGLGQFTNLTTLSVNNNALTALPGLSALTQLNYLYLYNNHFGNDIIAEIPNHTYASLNLALNNISDFTGVPAATTRNLGGQRVIGSDVILASADQDAYTDDPADRPVAFAGGSVYNYALSGADAGPVTFHKADLSAAADLTAAGWDLASVPGAFDTYSAYAWSLDPSGASDIANNGKSWIVYPTVIVDMADNPKLALTSGTALDEAVEDFSYSVDDPADPVFTPVSFALASGTLPTGITLDPVTGHLTGSTDTAGTYDFAISATDADGLTVTGSFTAIVADNPTSGSDDPPSIPDTTTPGSGDPPSIPDSTTPKTPAPTQATPAASTATSTPKTGDAGMFTVDAATAGALISSMIVLGLIVWRRKQSA